MFWFCRLSGIRSVLRKRSLSRQTELLYPRVLIFRPEVDLVPRKAVHEQGRSLVLKTRVE